MAAERRLAVAAVGFGLAAAFASWNPLAAPFGLVVGVAAIAISIRALRAGGRRKLAIAGLALSIAAVGASAVVLALTAGVGREPTGDPVVTGPSPAEVARELDAAEQRTRTARERARSELGSVEGGAAPAPEKGRGGEGKR
jgi:hypothetical protein